MCFLEITAVVWGGFNCPKEWQPTTFSIESILIPIMAHWKASFDGLFPISRLIH